MRLNAQNYSGCEISPVLESNYGKDVKHLALKRIQETGSTYKDSIVIPQSFQDTIFGGLAAIYNLENSTARDTVFNTYKIHQYLTLIDTAIYIGIYESTSWYSAWENLDIETENYLLDSLLNHYGFKLVHFSSAIHYATLTTEQEINLDPLITKLETVSGIKYAEKVGIPGDGNTITYNIEENIRYYDFSYRFGDCPSGCSESMTYKFKVNEDCSVEYLGRVDYLYNNIESTMAANKVLFPNPAENFIKFSNSLNATPTFYRINNHVGQVIKSGKLNPNNAINIADLKSGLYLVYIYDNSNAEIGQYKFIKR